MERFSTETVSIIINNYNYGRFLRCAIESALAQSYPHVEVIVVDDGSTDDSAQVIASYSTRIIPILKENGGQASALNAGFARSSGQFVIFLDADDTLHPTIVERVVRHFCANPEAVRVQYRLQVVNAEGLATGAFKPPPMVAIPSGDLRPALLHYGDDISWLPTSGNAFCAEMLQHIFPIPEREYRICADFYLSNLSPLYGRVIALDEVGGNYRVHGRNHHAKEEFDLQQTREIIIRSRETHNHIEERARELGLISEAEDGIASTSVIYRANRLTSLRLDPVNHPIKGDSRLALVREGIGATWRRADMALWLRVLYSGWFLLTAIAPQEGVRWLSRQRVRQ